MSNCAKPATQSVVCVCVLLCVKLLYVNVCVVDVKVLCHACHVKLLWMLSLCHVCEVIVCERCVCVRSCVYVSVCEIMCMLSLCV